MSDNENTKPLNDKQKRFCEEYCIDLNATQAAIRAGYSEKTAKEMGYENLTKPHLAEYVKELQDDIGKALGITRMSVAKELQKIAFANVSDYNSDWHELKDWNELTDYQKAAISEIVQTVTTFDGGEKVMVKFKLHDKLKGIADLNKMLGFNAPTLKAIDHTSGGEKIPYSLPIVKWVETEENE